MWSPIAVPTMVAGFPLQVGATGAGPAGVAGVPSVAPVKAYMVGPVVSH